MSHQAQLDASNRVPVRKGAAVLLMGAMAFLLGGCDSGGGGTDVTIGSGQNQDPVTLDFPVFYVKRPVPDPEDDELANADARELLRFEIGADLFMRDRASTSAAEVNLTSAQTEGLGDIRDVAVNYDGSKVLFSMRAQFIEDADEERSADLEHLGIRRGGPPAPARDHLGYRGRKPATTSCRTTCRTGASCSARRASRPRAPSCSTRTSRSSPAQDENDNEPAFVPARDGCRRHQHPSDLVQPESRPGSRGAAQRSRRVHALGTSDRRQPVRPVLGESRTARICNCCMARTVIRPARPIRRRPPR